jgi:hypothetical protein
MDPSHTESSSQPCTDMPCLLRHDEQVILAEGTFVFPKEKAFARNKLSLSDGTIIILSPPSDEAVRAQLSRENDGKYMTICGRIFTKQIPEKYGIISRTPDPYLVDIADISTDG